MVMPDLTNAATLMDKSSLIFPDAAGDQDRYRRFSVHWRRV